MRVIRPCLLLCAVALLASATVAVPPRAAAAPTAAPSIGGCAVLPANNIWNTPIDTAPVDARSAAYISSIGSDNSNHNLKADFGSGGFGGSTTIGIPFVVVPQSQALVPIIFSDDTSYPDQSDPGPFPVPRSAPVEGSPNTNGDRHVLVVQQGTCKLYELYRAFLNTNGSWNADSTAVYDLNSNALRPADWTSADAAGLPILPGLARYDEVAAGEIAHALRFTVEKTRTEYVWPARHQAGSTDALDVPPMGQRFRLKANVDISGFSRDTRVILTALKKYGMILADNGSNWYVSGAPDERWNNDVLQELRRVTGDQFEAVDVSGLQASPDSGQIKGSTSQTVRVFLPLTTN